MIAPFLNVSPSFDDSVWIAPSAVVVGDVSLGTDASIWYGAMLRGDVHYISIGERTNVQDLSVVHVSRGTHPCVIGAGVTIGHSVFVHGCTVEDDSLIGMGAVVLDGAIIGRGSLVGARALVTKDTIIPPNSLVLGTPAKAIRQLTDSEAESIRANATHYVRLARMYAGKEQPETNPFYVRP